MGNARFNYDYLIIRFNYDYLIIMTRNSVKCNFKLICLIV